MRVAAHAAGGSAGMILRSEIVVNLQSFASERDTIEGEVRV